MFYSSHSNAVAGTSRLILVQKVLQIIGGNFQLCSKTKEVRKFLVFGKG